MSVCSNNLLCKQEFLYNEIRDLVKRALSIEDIAKSNSI